MHDKQRKLAIGVSGNEKSQKKYIYEKQLKCQKKIIKCFLLCQKFQGKVAA